MLSVFSRKNTIRSIMLTTDFLKKSLETFFYKVRFWTFISCPFFKKIILSFKTVFLIFYNYKNISIFNGSLPVSVSRILYRHLYWYPCSTSRLFINNHFLGNRFDYLRIIGVPVVCCHRLLLDNYTTLGKCWISIFVIWVLFLPVH